MRHWTAFITFLVLPFVPAGADIFADFTVSKDGEPLGDFRVRLFHEEVPRVCANFIGLATGERPWLDPRTHRLREGVPFYDGLMFHRLIHSFVIQGGDPLGTGAGGPGYAFQDQFHPDLRHDGRYMLSMAHAGPNTNGAQFFITLADASFLDDYHSVFGEVIEGRHIIDGFADPDLHPVDQNDRPVDPLAIDSVVISGSARESFMAEHGASGLPQWRPVQKEISYSMVETDDGERPALRLHWDRRARWDYPVTATQDLAEWFRLGFGWSVDGEDGFSTEVTGVFVDDPEQEMSAFPAFFQVLGLDYSFLPEVPSSMLAAGTSIRLHLDEGDIVLQFAGESGTWTFEPSGGGSPVSGEMEDFYEDVENVLPEAGFFVGQDSTLANLSVTRMVTVFFDEPVGPQGWTAIQPTLSFHEAQGGWFNGPVNAENPANVPFRGQFEATLP